MGERLRALDARHPAVYDGLVTVLIALVGVVGLADGSLDAPVASAVPEPPAALPVALHVAFTVPVLWRRTRPLGVLWVVVAAAGVMVWSGLDHPGVLSLLVVACSAALRVPWPRLVPPAVALVAAVGATAVRWPPDEVAARYVPLLLVVAVAALLGLTVRSRREHHESQVGLAIAAERARIAREMHDVVAHNLAVMVALADGAAYSLPHAPEQATDLIEKAATAGREALGDMRRLVGVLRADEGGETGEAGEADGSTPGAPPPPRPQPGLDDLDALVEQVRAAGPTVRLTRLGTPGRWGPTAGLTIYRIVQEALTNAMKHAGPRATVDVRLCHTADAVDIEVTDDGGRDHAGSFRGGWGAEINAAVGGVGDEDHGYGHGLTGMAERAAAYGGRVEAGPRPGGGWRLVARLWFDRTDRLDRLDPQPGGRLDEHPGEYSDRLPDVGLGHRVSRWSGPRAGGGSGA